VEEVCGGCCELLSNLSFNLENRLPVKKAKISDEVAPIDESVSKECFRGCDPSIPITHNWQLQPPI
jgi:hypothetical protein